MTESAREAVDRGGSCEGKMSVRRANNVGLRKSEEGGKVRTFRQTQEKAYGGHRSTYMLPIFGILETPNKVALYIKRSPNAQVKSA